MITLFIVNLLVIWGLNFAFEVGNIFGFVKGWYHKNFMMLEQNTFAEFLEKPLFGCVMCMSSVWSIPFYTWAYINWDWSLWYWPIWVLCLTGASAILNR